MLSGTDLYREGTLMYRWRFVWGRSWIERQAAREADMIMREATRADAETLQRVAHLLREQVAETSTNTTQAEVDQVIARWFARHPERENLA